MTAPRPEAVATGRSFMADVAKNTKDARTLPSTACHGEPVQLTLSASEGNVNLSQQVLVTRLWKLEVDLRHRLRDTREDADAIAEIHDHVSQALLLAESELVISPAVQIDLDSDDEEAD